MVKELRKQLYNILIKLNNFTFFYSFFLISQPNICCRYSKHMSNKKITPSILVMLNQFFAPGSVCVCGGGGGGVQSRLCCWFIVYCSHYCLWDFLCLILVL